MTNINELIQQLDYACDISYRGQSPDPSTRGYIKQAITLLKILRDASEELPKERKGGNW